MIFREKKTSDDKIDICKNDYQPTMPNKTDSFLPPQTKFAKVMILHLSVILFTRGVSASVHAGIHTPWEQTHSLGADTPRSRHPWEQTPSQEQTSPRIRHPPPGSRHPLCSACWEILATSRWYASYWNAFLLFGLNWLDGTSY